MKKIFLSAITLLFVFASCSSSHRNDNYAASLESDTVIDCEGIPSYDENGELPPPPPIDGLATDSIEAKLPTKLVKKGNLCIITKNLTGSKAKVDSLLKKFGGYTENEVFNNGMANYRDAPKYTLILRVPSKNFEYFIDGLCSIKGQISTKNISKEDVTKKYIDLTSEKKSKDAEIESYRELLKQAKSVSDVIAVKKELDKLQVQANYTGQELKELNKDVEFSTIELSLNEPQPSKLWSDFKEYFGDGIITLTVLSPLIIFCVLIYFFIRFIKNRKK